MTKKQNEIAVRRQAIVDYINSFKDSKCRRPMRDIATILGYSLKQVRNDINYLAKKGTIDIQDRKVGYKKVRTLIGNPEESGYYQEEEITFSDFIYDGYHYKIPNTLPRDASRGRKMIATNYNQRPQRNGKAIPIDWDYWDKKGHQSMSKPVPVVSRGKTAFDFEGEYTVDMLTKEEYYG